MKKENCKISICGRFKEYTDGFCDKHHWKVVVRAKMTSAFCALPNEGKRSIEKFLHITEEEFEKIWT